MKDNRLHGITLLIVGLMVIRGMLYGLIIPYDRAPDEGHHFKLIKAKQMELLHASKAEKQRVAAQIELSSYYLLYPEVSPQKKSLHDFASAALLKPPSSFQIYYLVMAWILRLCSFDQVPDEVYLLRSISVLCGALVVLISYLATRELFPQNRFMLIGVPLLITFIPQFTAMNGVITNDKFTEVFMAVSYWFLIKNFKHGITPGYASGYVISIGLALLSKRTGMVALPLFLVAIGVYYWKWSLGWRWHLLLSGLALSMFGGGIGLMAWFHPENNEVLSEYMMVISAQEVVHFLLHESYSLAQLKYYLKFFTVMYWSFWGVFDYMSIPLHYFWYIGLALAQGSACVGIGKWIWQVSQKQVMLEPWRKKVLYLFGASIVLSIAMVFSRSVLLNPTNAFLDQGRRLFTVMIPIGLLTVWGLTGLFPPKAHRLVGTIGLIGLLALDVACLSNYLLLNFHLRALFG